MHLDIHKQGVSFPNLPRSKGLISGRVGLYGALGILLVASLVWSVQRVRAIDSTSQTELQNEQNACSVARAQALQSWTLTTSDLLHRATTIVNSAQRPVAIQMLEEAHRRDPKNRDVLIQLGYAYAAANRIPDAVSTLEAAKVVDPVYPVTYDLLAQVYARAGNTQAAATAIERAKQFALVAKLPDLAK